LCHTLLSVGTKTRRDDGVPKVRCGTCAIDSKTRKGDCLFSTWPAKAHNNYAAYDLCE
jgi:hypothetical protein